MIPNKDITKTEGFKKLMIFLLISIIILGWLFFKINRVFGITIIEDFEASEGYSVGNLNSQQGWSGVNDFQITDEAGYVKSGIQGVKNTTSTLLDEITKTLTSPINTAETNDIFNYSFNLKTGLTNYYRFVGISLRESEGLETHLKFYSQISDYGVYYSSHFYNCQTGEYLGEGDNGTLGGNDYLGESWNKIIYKIDTSKNLIWITTIDSNDVERKLSEIYNICFWLNHTGNDVIIDTLKLKILRNGMAWDLFERDIEVLEMRLWGISPESGTEVLDLDLNITIGYEGFDWDEYDGFTIAFWDERLHASSKVKVYIEDDLSPSGAGVVIVNLTDFGLDKKGKWYLTGLGFGTHLDIQSGMFLTTLGYVDFWTGELVDPEYYFIVVAEELPDLYPISNFEIWYGDNVEEFLAPTDFALAIAGFFQPILEKIGEFHARTQIFLDTNEAYARGKSMGDVFPIITGWVAQISYFMGGFPLVSWFKYLLIMLFAIFIIKAVLKFIPFFGK